MAKASTQYEQLVATLDASGLGKNTVKVEGIPGATLGSRLFSEVMITGFGSVFLSADKRITKVVTAEDGYVFIKPTPQQRADIFAAIQRAAITVRHREEVANGTRVLDMSIVEAVTGERFPATV